MKTTRNTFALVFSGLLAAITLAVPNLLAEPATGDAGNPFAQLAKDKDEFSGRYFAEDGRMVIKKSGAGYTGTVRFKDKSYPFKADDKDGRLEGTFGEGDETFPFDARLEGDSLNFHAGEFKTTLTRSRVPRLNGTYTGKTVSIKLQNKDAGTTGVIRLNGKEYQFAATESAGELQGIFKSGDHSFPFAVFQEPEKLMFQSDKFTEALQFDNSEEIQQQKEAARLANVAKAAEEKRRADVILANDEIRSGVAKQKTNDLTGAIADYTKAIELQPDFAVAYRNRGGAKLENCDFAGAIADFTKTIELKPDDKMAYVGRGQAKGLTADQGGALSDLNQAIQLDPQYARAYWGRGRIHYDAHESSEALADYEKSFVLGNTNPYICFEIWVVRSRLGEEKAANAWLKTCMANRGSDKQGDWFSIITQFLVGDISESKFLSAAGKVAPKRPKQAADARELAAAIVNNVLPTALGSKQRNSGLEPDTDQSSDAYMFAGLKRLIAGDKVTAADYFQKVIDMDSSYPLEKLKAAAELKYLKTEYPPPPLIVDPCAFWAQATRLPCRATRPAHAAF